eukprot:4644196-Prymnesium_polylepis.1
MTVYLGIESFADSNLTKPAEVHHQSTNKSITGGGIMLGGCILDPMSQRQHLAAAPDAHTGEMHAASTVQHKLAPHRGLLQELVIPQPHPAPLWLDSATTIFAGNDSGSVRRSVWTRCAGVIPQRRDLPQRRGHRPHPRVR